MTIDPTLVGLGILVSIVVYQQWTIRKIQIDLDDVIDGHNHLVNTIVQISKDNVIYV
jgi:hypothetical protein